MGTNYYWIHDPCAHCGRSDEENKLHIGKRSAGWEFHFHCRFEGPNGPLRSFKEWRALTESGQGYIRNEYGERVATEAFWNEVVLPTKGRLNHLVECAQHYVNFEPRMRPYKDEDGWCFDPGVFA